MTLNSLAQVQVEALPWRGDLDRQTLDVWRTLLAHHQQLPVFCYPEWLLAACNAKALMPWRILVIRQAQHPLAIIPLRKRTRWTAEVCLPLAEDFPMLITNPAEEELVWLSLAQWLHETPGIHLLSLGRWRETERMTALQQTACAQGAYAYLREVWPDIWISLPATWEEYFTSLGQSTRKTLQRRERQLTRDFGEAIQVDILTEEATCLAALEEFFALHHQRWQGHRGSYFDNPHNVTMYREVIRWMANKGYLAMPILRFHGRTVVVGTIFHIPGQQAAYAHCLVRDTNVLPSNYSPGTVLTTHVIRWAIAHGIQRLSLGLSAHAYKFLFGGKEMTRSEVFLASSYQDARLYSKLDPAIHILAHLPSELRYYWGRLREKQEMAKAMASISKA